MSGLSRNTSMSVKGIPPMLEIPDTEKQIKKALRECGKGNYHPGLLAACKSVKNNRSAKNAYILLLGQTGAGKSSTINFLFENQQITETGDSISLTSEILEFAASVPVPELGIKNAEIRVIDTPGLGDTRGIENDAKFIATLSDYLKNHEDLSKALPNIVIIVGKFDDTRLDGPTSGFSRMLKGVKLLEEQLVDKRFSNIIIVLTHYMNGKKALKENPLPRYELVARLVKDVGFPEPITVIGAENEAEDLEEMNGYYKLPNGEYYPYNIFRRIQQITTEADPIGESIIRTAFTNPAALQISRRKQMELLGGSNNPMYVKAVDHFIDINFTAPSTPISNKLADVWENSIHPDFRKNYAGSLKIVQNIFQVRHIKEFHQLPKNPEDIIKFLKEIPQNEAILALLEKALGLIVPELNIAYLVGQGYDVLKDHSASSPFQFTNYKSSPLGYKLPIGIKCELVKETEDICVFNESKQDYTSRRLTDLNLPPTEISMLNSNIKAGYNVFKQMKENNNNEFTTVREHRVFQLTLEDPTLSPAFIKEIQSLPTFNPDQVHIKQIWKGFFDRYGTHVVTSAYGGGSIETYIQENHVKTLLEKVGGDFSKAMGNLTSLDRDLTASQSHKDGEIIQAFGVKFRGGNMKYHKSDLSNLDPAEAAATLENWRTSLTVEPIMLDTKLKLMPLSYYLRKKFSSIANEVEVACRALFDNSFNFVPTESQAPPPKRFDVKGLSDFDKSSCLKAGTLILMADGTLKPVETIKAGDKILDKDLNPSSVIGCNSFFLGQRSFYGFSSEETCFFTEVHIFLSPDLLYNVVSKKSFLRENPVFELLEHQIISLQKGINFNILHYDPTQKLVSPMECQLYESQSSFPSNTPVYFLEVDNPSGTYFANGFLCRHELPVFELWPKTFDCLQQMLFNPKTIAQIGNIQLDCYSYHDLTLLAQEIASDLKKGLETGNYLQDSSSNQGISKVLSMTEIQSRLKLVLENQALVAFGLLIYSKCGKLLYNYLDRQNLTQTNGNTVNIDLIRNIVNEKLKLFLEVREFEE